MIVGKTIKLGYGDIVAVYDYGKTAIIEFDPRGEIGIPVSLEGRKVLNEIIWNFDVDFFTLLRELKTVTKDKYLIKFRNYKIDFSNFNKKSVEAFIGYIEHSIHLNARKLAC